MDKTFSISLMVLGMSIVALAMSLVFVSVFNGISRNPSAEEKMSKYIFVAAGLVEALGLFAFIVILLSIFS